MTKTARVYRLIIYKHIHIYGIYKFIIVFVATRVIIFGNILRKT